MTLLLRRELLTGGYTPVPLTLSGNEQTPATRAAATQGDGLTGPYAGSSIGVWEATTNLVTNGGFETDATGWSDGANFTIARSTARAKFGSASGRSTCDNTGTGTMANHAFTAAGASAHYGSMWVYVPSTWTGGTLTLSIENLTSVTGTILGSVNMSLVDQWQWVTVGPFTPDAGDLTGNFILKTLLGNANVGEFVDIDGVQIEAQPLPTPYVHTDGGTASRTASNVRFPSRYINTTQGWFCVLTKVPWSNTIEPLGGAGFPRLIEWANDNDNRYSIMYDEGNNRFELASNIATVVTSDTVARTIAADDIVFAAGYWTSAAVGLSVDGSAFSATAGGTRPTITNASVFVGSSITPSGHFDANILFIACGKGTLSDANAAAMNNIARNNRINSRPEDLPGGCTFKWPPADGDWRNGVAA